MQPDPFLAVEQRPHTLSEGTCDLPILYRDASWCGLFYRVDLGAVAAEMEGLSIEPMPVFGAAVAAIYAWEYRDSSVGSYGEVGLGVQARRKGTRPSVLRLAWDMAADDDQGIWVLSLPVTTAAAHRAGVEIWGYPKYVTPIETRFGARDATVRLGDELTLRLGGVRGLARTLPVVTYTRREDTIVRTSIEVDCAPTLGLASGAGLELHGDGPTARIVRALRMHEKKPLAAFHTNAFRARLPAGRELGSAR